MPQSVWAPTRTNKGCRLPQDQTPATSLLLRFDFGSSGSGVTVSQSTVSDESGGGKAKRFVITNSARERVDDFAVARRLRFVLIREIEEGDAADRHRQRSTSSTSWQLDRRQISASKVAYIFPQSRFTVTDSPFSSSLSFYVPTASVHGTSFTLKLDEDSRPWNWRVSRA